MSGCIVNDQHAPGRRQAKKLRPLVRRAVRRNQSWGR